MTAKEEGPRQESGPFFMNDVPRHQRTMPQDVTPRYLVGSKPHRSRSNSQSSRTPSLESDTPTPLQPSSGLVHRRMWEIDSCRGICLTSVSTNEKNDCRDGNYIQDHERKHGGMCGEPSSMSVRRKLTGVESATTFRPINQPLVSTHPEQVKSGGDYIEYHERGSRGSTEK